MDNKIMVLDRVEDLHDDKENVIGRLVTDKAGNQLKIKKGQGGKLENRWDELDGAVGKAYQFTMGEFKGYPFVQDFQEVKGVFQQQAAKEIAEAMPNEQDTRLRSYALAYAKDLVVSRDISIRGSSPKDPNDQSVRSLDFTEMDIVFDHFSTILRGKEVSNVKTETPKEHETDDPAEILKPEDEPEVSWESIRPKLSELYNQKMLTMDKTLKQLADLGADTSVRNVKTAFESLNLESKQKFAKIIVGITAKKED